MESSNTLKNLVKNWLAVDRDASTRAEITNLLNSNNASELRSRLSERITFGTAGLRSNMKAGFAHMNSYTVLQASQGLASYLLKQNLQSNAVVIGHDARHNSERFARLAATAFLTNGFTVLWFEDLIHTPLVTFSVRQFGAAAGVMVTASHNPKNDNGYKVYWGNGCQILSPRDSEISDEIAKVGEVKCWDDTLVDTNDNLVSSPSKGEWEGFTYTPMHGVGLPFMLRITTLLGIPNQVVNVVQSQAKPDANFPTVPFPNPEEKGALDQAFAAASKCGSRIVIANDPDADRFAAAEQLGDGTWRQFTGNQMGVLLASYVLEIYPDKYDKLAMLASTVSSRMLAAMAAKEGFFFKETLTGFKWLGNAAQDLAEEGYTVGFAYEEAIGYMFPSVVWDKDGIAAAAMFLSARQFWQRNQGLTPWGKLQELYKTYGYFEDVNTYLITPSKDVTETVFGQIRKERSRQIGKREILRWRDLTVGYDSSIADGRPDLPTDPATQMITCELEDVVFTVRSSGTEPKIKIYLEARGKSTAEAKTLASTVFDDVIREWFKPGYGLKLVGS
ncbi:hypothetical protein K470DRAFT_242478 [Piedraia hortae CBS 480.64]|uniref:Phosphoglucomutase-2 n=1 Tax=Piedraia hortae CBS 480.64 TaxID=1314780 RepID=A0A6A7C8U9_9PEZI|nr:hypothetical protein K470DRAFT_242478 [Piedraia hortae CBS 480.64]